MTNSWTKLLLSVGCILGFILASDARALGQGLPPATQAGVVDTSVGVPEAGNASESKQLATTSVDPSTGIASTSIHIVTPPARGLAQPDLTLEYSSEGGAGYAGFEWTLALPSIERRPLSGPPTFEAPPKVPSAWTPKDQFFYQGRRLLPVCWVHECAAQASAFPSERLPTSFNGVSADAWWYFRESEETDFARFFLSPDQQTWVIQTKSGQTMELGKPLVNASVVQCG